MNLLDFTLIALYLAGITLYGLRFRKRQRSLRDYFLADRNIPWWAISLSIVAAETSTLTIISVPGIAYDSNFTFLQLVFGYLVGRVIVAFVLLPQYFRGELFTAYQLIERRFGQRLRSLTAGLFLVTRAAAEGVRIFAVALVVGIALGPLLGARGELQRDVISIGIVTLLTLLYTFEGGMTAVIWTDVVQMAIYVGGTLVGLFTILHLVPGGWNTIHATAASAGKFRVFDFTPDFYRTYTFWSGVIGGAFLNTASHGTDQLIVQRLLAARSEGQSKLALLSSGIAVLLPVLALPADRCHVVGLLPHLAARGSLRQDRPHLSDVHRELHAARYFRNSHRGDSGRCDVEPERRTEFAIVHLDDRFLSPP